MTQIQRYLAPLIVVSSIFSLTASLAQAQNAVPTTVGPITNNSIVGGSQQTVTFDVSWTNMPAGQNIDIDIYFEIVNKATGARTGLVKMLTVHTYGTVSNSTGGSIYGPNLMAPLGFPGDQAQVSVVTRPAPGFGAGGVMSADPTYQ